MSQITSNKLLEDPLLAVSLQGVYMRICTLSNLKSSICGYFYCIDPASGTIALLLTDESSSNKIFQVEFVFSHSIAKIEVDSSKTLSKETIALVAETLKPKSEAALSPEELAVRRDDLLKILKETQLPYEESDDGKFTVASVAVIDPPYSHRDIKCSNVIVYTRLKELLSPSSSE